MDIYNSFEEINFAVCPLCRGEAEWNFLDDDPTRVEVICSNCGRLEAPRASFEEAQAGAAQREQEDES